MFVKIYQQKGEVLLGDLVILLRALNEDIDNDIEVEKFRWIIHIAWYQVRILLEQFAINGYLILNPRTCCVSEDDSNTKNKEYLQDLIKEVMDAGWDGSFTLEPKDLTARDMRVILESKEEEPESKVPISQEISHIKVF